MARASDRCTATSCTGVWRIASAAGAAVATMRRGQCGRRGPRSTPHHRESGPPDGSCAGRGVCSRETAWRMPALATPEISATAVVKRRTADLEIIRLWCRPTRSPARPRPRASSWWCSWRAGCRCGSADHRLAASRSAVTGNGPCGRLSARQPNDSVPEQLPRSGESPLTQLPRNPLPLDSWPAPSPHERAVFAPEWSRLIKRRLA
jgi:hypothetical protein